MGPLGGTELIIILVIVLLLFGARRLPELGRSLGSGMREFKGAVTGSHRDDEDREALNEGAKPTQASDATHREGAAQPRA
ncbi:MAG TPA: twin-arginine translocase TatA/TatE family subunit [Solirubrobacteraceae bacterium]|nr:twin-arginine translocase TatA/TatE family subunit [Solirubrobacteraceae bacterium]